MTTTKIAIFGNVELMILQ